MALAASNLLYVPLFLVVTGPTLLAIGVLSLVLRWPWSAPSTSTSCLR